MFYYALILFFECEAQVGGSLSSTTNNHSEKFSKQLNDGAKVLSEKSLFESNDTSFEQSSERTDFFEHGEQLFKEHNYEKAAEYFTEAVIKYPSHRRMYLRNRALCYFNMGKWDLAAIDYQNVLRSNPRNARACYFFGLTLLKLNDYNNALEYLQKAADLGKASGIPDFEIDKALAEIHEAQKMKLKENKTDEIEFQHFLETLLKENLEREVSKTGTTMEIETKYKNYRTLLTSIFAEKQGKMQTHTESEIPEYLCDPITSKLFKEPVITATDGITYEEEVILRHLKEIGNFDPSTHRKLSTKQLIRNYAVKEVVHAFLEKNSQPDETQKFEN